MCGICGIVGSRALPSIHRMMASLHHRGPDEDGVWLGDNVALGIKRLAIIDPETGQQPVFNEDRTVVAVMNGEIYNHSDLRKELENDYSFSSSHSDILLSHSLLGLSSNDFNKPSVLLKFKLEFLQ